MILIESARACGGAARVARTCSAMAAIDNFKCGICLELFQDPRNLPCLHTFCRECLQRSLNENRSLKCPICRAKHELDGAELLPADQYTLQQLPLRKLQQQREENKECKLCDEQAPLVAWCDDCDAMICQPCVALHKKIVTWRVHHVIKKGEEEPRASWERRAVILNCSRHTGLELKYFCTRCSELVCAECLLFAHKDHQYSIVKDARHSLEIKLEELASLAVKKKKEFKKYVEKVDKVEGKALECSELMKSEVNSAFDGLVALVEAQRNEALQRASQGVKEIWSQKEMAEVTIAQLDSFTRFADHTHKCMTDASYIAMATQGIKLMERLKNSQGDESVLDHKMMAVGSGISEGISFDKMLQLGQPSLKFTPEDGSTIEVDCEHVEFCFKVAVMVEDLPVIASQKLREKCQLLVEPEYMTAGKVLSPNLNMKLVETRELQWEITIDYVHKWKYLDAVIIILWCTLTGDLTTEDGVTYTHEHNTNTK